MMRSLSAPLMFTAAVVMLAGCSDQGDDPVDEGGPLDPPTAVSFADDIQPIFDASCAGCHGVGGAAGLNLTAGASYAQLVGVEAAESDLNRVEPGEPNQSWLYLKITGNQDVGDSMPPSGLLPSASRDLVRDWIADGAPDN
jgi:mono/diheme cytochrome c family protein